MDAPQAWLDEIFLSLQGEAGEAGRPHLFLRFAGCPLRCCYCDTPRSWKAGQRWERHERGGTVERPNPVPAEALLGELEAVAASHEAPLAELTLAVTGGEPLEQTPFLLAFLPSWPGRVLLETAGLDPERLERLLPWVDFVSLDWKLDSTLRAGRERVAPAECARLFAESGAAGWVKVVVCEDTPETEVLEALTALARRTPGLRVFLQPATPVPGGPAGPPPARLLEWTLRGLDLPLDLRVLPQLHPILGLR